MKIPGLLILACSISAAFVFAADTSFTLPRETAKLKPSPGAELVTAQCLICHSADYISTQPRLTRAQWQASVTKMQQKYGATISTNNMDRLVNYLVSNYGSALGRTK
jgi:cytochrome c553